MTPQRGLVLVVLGALCWGAGGLAGALLGAEAQLGSGAVAAYRLLGGGLVILASTAAVEVLRPRGRLRVASRAAWGRVAIVAALIAVFQAAYFEAVFRVGVAVATVVTLGMAPVLVAGVFAARRRRLPAPRVVAALASAVVGLVLLVVLGATESVTPGAVTGGGAGAGGAGGASGATAGGVAVGVAFALLAAVAFATLVVVNRRPVRGLGPIVMTGLSFTAGGVILVPLAVASGGIGLPTTALGWGWLALLAIVPTALAYALYFTGLPAAGATPAALAALLEPCAAAVLAVVVLGERLDTVGWFGAGLLVLAVILARPRTAPSPTMVLGPRAARGRRPAAVRAAADEHWE